MNEVIERSTVLNSPLSAKHKVLAATLRERDGWSVPASYGAEASEYAAVREEGLGLIDLSPRGRMLVSGSEAVQFLNGLITNDMKTLAEGSWMPATFPNVQGRLIASVRVVRLGEKLKDIGATFLLDTEPATRDRVLKTIERFTLAGDFHVQDITHRSAHLSIQGVKSADVVRSVLGNDAAPLLSNGAMNCYWQDGDVTVIRGSHTGEDGFDLILNSEQAESLWDALSDAGAHPVGYNMLETLRIEAGIPRYGIDMDESHVITETSLDEAVSYTKGCYVGQEIIARIKYRGHVAKKLSGLILQERSQIKSNALIKSQDKDIGRVTSVTYSPRLDRTIALGYLKYDYLAPGTKVAIETEHQQFTAEVTELPFFKRLH